MTGGILITGGAGYVGSCFAWACRDAGIPFAILDDLSTGDRRAPPASAPFVVAKASDRAAVMRLVHQHGLDTIVHFAASTSVEESVRDPGKHERNNVEETRGLIETTMELGLRNFVLCSTAAVYGDGHEDCVSEETPAVPLNPYGQSKLDAEAPLAEAQAIGGPRFVALRAFNVAGADPRLRTGRRAGGEGNLIGVCCDVALDRSKAVVIHGADYPTPDGTCIRDYVHVADLVEAHISAVAHLARGGESMVLNCGNGQGHSVRQVIAAFDEVLGRKLATTPGPARPGDPIQVVADTSLITATLGWTPRRADLRTMVRSALEWRQSHVVAV